MKFKKVTIDDTRLVSASGENFTSDKAATVAINKYIRGLYPYFSTSQFMKFKKEKVTIEDTTETSPPTNL